MSSNTTFSPSSLAFENAVNGTTSVLTLTITNNGSSDVTITGPAAPFSMDPASVTVAAGDAVDVSVAFSPTGDADDDYTSTITSDDGGSVAVSGSGLAPVSSDESQTGTHLLMKVDDYTDGLFAKYAEDGDELDEQLTMTSYLRIGLFDYATESDKAKQLLDLIPQVRASTNPNGSPSATSERN